MLRAALLTVAALLAAGPSAAGGSSDAPADNPAAQAQQKRGGWDEIESLAKDPPGALDETEREALRGAQQRPPPRRVPEKPPEVPPPPPINEPGTPTEAPPGPAVETPGEASPSGIPAGAAPGALGQGQVPAARRPPPEETGGSGPAFTAGAAVTAGPVGSPPETPAGESASAPPAGSVAGRGAKAVKRAARIGESLKKSFGESAGGFPGGTAGPSGSAPKRLPEPGAAALSASRPGGDPSRPRDEQDLSVAAITGFGASFSALGLRPARGPRGEALILRRDGGPASPAELSALKERIAQEPTALMRRPDFYSVLPREEFFQLKQDYRARPELRGSLFQDVAMTDSGRDFVRTASCQRISGACNASTEEHSYQKGDLVSPEDLRDMANRLHGDEDEENTFKNYSGPANSPTGAAAAAAPASRLKDSIYDKLNVLADSLVSFMGGPGSSGGGDQGGEASVVAAASPSAGGAAVESGAASPERRRPTAPGSAGRIESAKTAAAAGPVSWRRRGRLPLAGAVAGILILLAWRRERRGP